MRAIVQRVSSASVSIDVAMERKTVGKIGSGLIIFLGVGKDDGEKEAEYLAEKITQLRIFMDKNEKMNLSIADLSLEALVISQFTLYADARKGRRPSFSMAAGNEKALGLYQFFTSRLETLGIPTQKGAFGEIMHIEAALEGPVSILLDSDKMF